MNFKPMDQDLIRDLLKDAPNVLEEEKEEEDYFYSGLECPACSNNGAKKIIKETKMVETPSGPQIVFPFTEGRSLPAGNAICNSCSTIYDPFTKVIHKTEASLIDIPDPMII